MSEELKPSAEAERRMRLEDLTKNLPPLPDIPWVWTDEETEMLRAACATRFGESVRTETLFAIAATGIRIYMSRATITTDNTRAAAELTIKLREANALIDRLVEALKDAKRDIGFYRNLLAYENNGRGDYADYAIDGVMEDRGKRANRITLNIDRALAEAKKWREKQCQTL